MMSKSDSKPLLIKKDIRRSVLLLCCIFIFEIVISRNHWNRDYMHVSYNDTEGAMVMTFEFFDYEFGPANENGYLEYCDFLYTSDDVHFYHFMKAETEDQETKPWSWIKMSNKLLGTKLQFFNCYYPPEGTMWDDSVFLQRVEVFNTYFWDKAYLTIKWLTGTTYYNIRIIGKWHVNGVWPNEYFDETYNIAKSIGPELNSEEKTNSNNKCLVAPNTDQPKNSAVMVCKEAGAIVIKGVDPGEDIEVYTVAGAQIITTVAKNDVVKIKLHANQIYILRIGQARYKVAL